MKFDYMASTLFFAGTLLLSSAVHAGVSDSNISVFLDRSGTSLTVTKGDTAEGRTCALKGKSNKAQLSHDRSAVILSDVTFIPVSTLWNCGSKSLVPRRISSKVGFLVDVNMSKKLFLTLDLISTSPLAFLATVSRFDSTKNLVSLPGAYVQGRSLSKLQEQGFSYDPDFASPRISPNGRYVSPGGAPDCTQNAYPGVWDIVHNKRIVMTGSAEENTEACNRLFEE